MLDEEALLVALVAIDLLQHVHPVAQRAVKGSPKVMGPLVAVWRAVSTWRPEPSIRRKDRTSVPWNAVQYPKDLESMELSAVSAKW